MQVSTLKALAIRAGYNNPVLVHSMLKPEQIKQLYPDAQVGVSLPSFPVRLRVPQASECLIASFPCTHHSVAKANK